ncbi:MULTISPECIES: hypothetical protein [Terrabacteria group]|uniref:hypothetical protein n=1 Tax=Bacillati TaxID=1783272 RepID=UPI000C7C5E84|nr:hypothetical protein [Planomicrobium sp. MB-3u-38]PKH10663.1 hypothetical protein CXF70_08610 [Planomicrobium sp. MB-3u-38]
MAEVEYLKEWRKKLELEIQVYTSQLKEFEKNREELNLKKLILTEIAVRQKSDTDYSTEAFKSHFDFGEISAKLKHLQSETQKKLEEELIKKIHFNELVIDRIKTIT